MDIINTGARTYFGSYPTLSAGCQSRSPGLSSNNVWYILMDNCCLYIYIHTFLYLWITKLFWYINIYTYTYTIYIRIHVINNIYTHDYTIATCSMYIHPHQWWPGLAVTPQRSPHLGPSSAVGPSVSPVASSAPEEPPGFRTENTRIYREVLEANEVR